MTFSNYVDIKQRTVADWERIIKRGSPTRCRGLIAKAIRQRIAWLSSGDVVSLTTSQRNLLEAALNTGDL